MRICRILGTPRGSALLVGVGGSGKQTLTRLAAYVAGATFFQATISKQYSTHSLLEDFKPLYRQAGVSGKGVAFIFTDKEIKQEAFLEYIVSLSRMILPVAREHIEGTVALPNPRPLSIAIPTLQAMRSL